MEEAARDEAAAAAGRRRRRAIGVRHFGERLVAARLDDRRIMEFMAAIARAFASERMVAKQRRLSVAERHPPRGERADKTEQARHFMADAVRVDQAAAERHVAAAFAMDRLRRGEAPDSAEEILRRR